MRKHTDVTAFVHLLKLLRDRNGALSNSQALNSHRDECHSERGVSALSLAMVLNTFLQGYILFSVGWAPVPLHWHRTALGVTSYKVIMIPTLLVVSNKSKDVLLKWKYTSSKDNLNYWIHCTLITSWLNRLLE